MNEYQNRFFQQSNAEYEEGKQTVREGGGKKRGEKRNVTLTNDNWCITLLWGSLCRQQGSWDRWRPIWANPQLKGAINQSLSVFMGKGCEASISLSVTVKTISELTKSRTHRWGGKSNAFKCTFHLLEVEKGKEKKTIVQHQAAGEPPSVKRCLKSSHPVLSAWHILRGQ